MYQVTPYQRVMTEHDATGMVGDPVPDRDADLTTATVAVDADTGDPAFAYLPLGDVSHLRRDVLDLPIRRETIRASGLRYAARTFGYSPRRPHYGRDGCRPTNLATETPDAHAGIVRFGEHLTRMLADTFPTIAAADRDTIEQVKPDWRLGETSWTSGIVNQSTDLPYHRDGYNFAVWTAMPVLRRHMTGGYLHIPEYDVTVESRDGWAVFFPGYHLVHGVTPMRPTRDDGYRYSVVYYALRGMKDCLEHALEQDHAKRKRTERERAMAERLTHGIPAPVGKHAHSGGHD